jgi:hypothetical protein
MSAGSMNQAFTLSIDSCVGVSFIKQTFLSQIDKAGVINQAPALNIRLQ